MAKRKLTLKQVMPPPAFEVCDPDQPNRYRVATMDAQSSDIIHWEAPIRYSTEDVIRAAGREMAGGEGRCAIQKIEGGFPVSCEVYDVLYALNRWHWRKV